MGCDHIECNPRRVCVDNSHSTKAARAMPRDTPAAPRLRPRAWMTVPALIFTIALCMIGGPLIGVVLSQGKESLRWLVTAFVLVVVLVVLLPLLGWAGWLRDVLFERRRHRGALALALALAPLVYIVYCFAITGWSQLPEGSWIVLAFLSALQAGVWEELAFRGIGLVTLRARFNEVWCAVILSVLFGSFHLLNLTGGGPLGETLEQTFYAGMYGFVFYAIRRTTGTIFVPMALHFANNFAEGLAEKTGGMSSRGFGVTDVIFYGCLLVGLVAAFLVLRRSVQEDRAARSAASEITGTPL